MQGLLVSVAMELPGDNGKRQAARPQKGGIMFEKENDGSLGVVTIRVADSASGTYEISSSTMQKVAALIAREEEGMTTRLRTPLPIRLPF